MTERRANWTPAAMIFGGVLLAIVALLLIFRGGDPPAPVPSAPTPASSPSPPTPSASPPPVVAEIDAALPPLDGDVTDEELGLSMPHPSKVDVDAQNPTIKPELPQTPDWKMGKTQQILAVVGRRAERVQKEIADLEKQGKTAEAEEKKILLKRLNLRMDAMRKDIEQFKKEIIADGGVVPDGGFAPDAAPIW